MTGLIVYFFIRQWQSIQKNIFKSLGKKPSSWHRLNFKQTSFNIHTHEMIDRLNITLLGSKSCFKVTTPRYLQHYQEVWFPDSIGPQCLSYTWPDAGNHRESLLLSMICKLPLRQRISSVQWHLLSNSVTNFPVNGTSETQFRKS